LSEERLSPIRRGKEAFDLAAEPGIGRTPRRDERRPALRRELERLVEQRPRSPPIVLPMVPPSASPVPLTIRQARNSRGTITLRAVGATNSPLTVPVGLSFVAIRPGQ
jgi:hypothetical protein